MTCPVFRPDHNGECLNCDEWFDAHTPEAIAAGQTPRTTDTDSDNAIPRMAAFIDRLAEALKRPHYTCPRCGSVSFNPHDVRERYCGRCHQFEQP